MEHKLLVDAKKEVKKTLNTTQTFQVGTLKLAHGKDMGKIIKTQILVVMRTALRDFNCRSWRKRHTGPIESLSTKLAD